MRAAIAAACQVLHRCDAVFSTWDTGSPVSRFRRGEATLGQMPPEFHEVLRECHAARGASGGWFDPWAMPGGFDPTGLVKGWATERALGVLRDAGLPGALVNGGGDVAAFGSPAGGQRWRVGIRHPWRAGRAGGRGRDRPGPVTEERGLEPAGGSGPCAPGARPRGKGVPPRASIAAAATSGSYERGAHLIDPATGRPVSRAASATVTGPSLALADALATGVAVGGDEALAAVARLAGYAAYLIRPDGSETGTGGIAFVCLSRPLAGASLGRAGGTPASSAGGRVLAAGTPQRPLAVRRAGGALASTARRSARRLRRDTALAHPWKPGRHKHRPATAA